MYVGVGDMCQELWVKVPCQDSTEGLSVRPDESYPAKGMYNYVYVHSVCMWSGFVVQRVGCVWVKGWRLIVRRLHSTKNSIGMLTYVCMAEEYVPISKCCIIFYSYCIFSSS